MNKLHYVFLEILKYTLKQDQINSIDLPNPGLQVFNHGVHLHNPFASKAVSIINKV